MKRKFSALLAALFCLTCLFPALAEDDSSDSPGYMELVLDGDSLTLDFDDDPYYSMHESGYVQASFYAYANDTLYEVYMIFPDTLQAGDVLSTESCLADGDEYSGIVLYVTDADTTETALATQFSDGAYPTGSSYEITFTEFSDDGTTVTAAGSLEATLVDVDDDYASESSTRTLQAYFQLELTESDDDSYYYYYDDEDDEDDEEDEGDSSFFDDEDEDEDDEDAQDDSESDDSGADGGSVTPTPSPTTAPTPTQTVSPKMYKV